MPSEVYPITRQDTDIGTVHRLYLPLLVANPQLGAVVKTMALVDTGADACMFNRTICSALGHDLKGDGVVHSVSGGIGTDVTTYRHTFVLSLLAPDRDDVSWESPPMLIDCIDRDIAEIAPLLGTADFLCHFRIQIDYPAGLSRFTW